MKVLWSTRFLISMQMVCSQADWILSSNLRTAFNNCVSGRYLSTVLSFGSEVALSMVSIGV